MTGRPPFRPWIRARRQAIPRPRLHVAWVDGHQALVDLYVGTSAGDSIVSVGFVWDSPPAWAARAVDRMAR